MKILFTADLHYGFDIFSSERISTMIEKMKLENPDMVIINGDIGEGRENIYQCLKLFKMMDCPVGVILGNHDIWNYYGYSTIDLWSNIIPDMVNDLGFLFLENQIINMDNIAIIGGIAWYDYSSKTSNEFDDNWYFNNKKKFNNDGNFINWEYTDIEFADNCREGIIKRVKAASPYYEKIIVATHVPILPQQTVRYVSDNHYGNAYFGNYTIGEEIMQYDKVTHIVSGHTHRGMVREVLGKHISVINSDYTTPKYLRLEL